MECISVEVIDILNTVTISCPESELSERKYVF
jgi:hypothetical protein